MLNWEKIYELNDNNNKRAGTNFEKLVLNYLSSVYSKYSWKNTQSSWDNNRDFVSLILDNIWGEAKYKKDSSSLGKKDVDPTMISGFLNERIKLVFIITNGQIPPTISTRINETGRKCGFTVVCITQTQLEYWLIAHPEQYEVFFKEPLPNVCQLKAVNIENVCLENQLDANFESSYIQPEFIMDSICNLCVTFSCNIDLECNIIEKEEYPFQFIESPRILLSPGVQHKYFPVKLVRVNNDPIVLEFMNTDGTVLNYILDVKIVSKQNLDIIYSQQELIKIEINDAINLLLNTNNNFAIAIEGEEGYGKTFLMKEIAKDLCFSNVVAVLQCETSNCSGLNSMKLCQMIMYINYGDIYQNGDEYNIETRNYYKYLLKRNNHDKLISDELLTDIFDGCFDRIIAQNIISRLSKENSSVIKKSQFARRHVLLMDDIHLFTAEELNVFRIIVQQFKYSNNNLVLIFSSETCLVDKAEITSYKLEGLSEEDIKECLRCNLNEWQYNTFCLIEEKIPHHPKMVNDLITYIKSNFSLNLSLENVNQYITKMKNNKLSSFNFKLSIKERLVMELIINFSKGIDKELLLAIKIDEEILNSLYNKGYILYYKQRYMPCLDYFLYTYKNQHSSDSPNIQLSRYLFELLDKSYLDPLFDAFQAQALLIQYNPQLYSQVKVTYKTKMMEYINKGCYKEAMIYGEIFCFEMLNDKLQCHKADMDALFYYGISLIHCDTQRRAIDIFTYIRNHSDRNTLNYFRASAELLNNKYSRFQIRDILQKTIVLKHDMYAAIKKSKDENSLETHQLRIAYSTCMNRMMMIYFLKDNFDKALEIYNEYCKYHSALPKCKYSDKYNSMLLEWKMDYARGSAIYGLNNSISIDNECYSGFSEDKDFRRKILCKIDKLFFETIQSKNYDEAISELIRCKQDLALRDIVSEDMKTSIRITYCRLMKYVCIPEFDNISLLEPFVDEIYAEVFSAQIESHVIAQGRTAYLLNNLLAILHIIKNDIKTAAEMLEYSNKLIQDCGLEYHRIIEHNYQHINNIKKIDWYFHDNIMHVDTYYLDMRVW